MARTTIFLLAFSAACVPDDQVSRNSPIDDLEIFPGNEFERVGPDESSDQGTPPRTMPGEMIAWMRYEPQQERSNEAWGPVLTDIINHLPSSYGDTYWSSDRITWAHETTHGINAHLRNNYNDTGATANAFYVGEDRAAIVVEPNIRKSQVAELVPELLRGSRFDTYVAGQAEWDDRPLYILDELVAYTNGGATGIDMVQRGLWTAGRRDGVSGQLEFSVYALALAMAIEQYDPDYLLEHAEFLELLAYHLRRAISLHLIGRELPEFAMASQEQYLEDLRNAPEAEPLRIFAQRVFGEEFMRRALLGLNN